MQWPSIQGWVYNPVVRNPLGKDGFMARIFISPSKYIQGPGERDNLGTYT